MMQIDVGQEIKVQLILYLSRIKSTRHDNPFVMNDSIDLCIQQLSVAELQEIATLLPDQAIRIHVNAESLQRSIQQQQRSAKQRRIIHDLVKANASQPVMSALFGLTSSDISQLRQTLNVTRVNGRPAALTDAQQMTIRRMWKSLAHIDTDGERLLALHEKTKLPVSQLWEPVKTLIQ